MTSNNKLESVTAQLSKQIKDLKLRCSNVSDAICNNSPIELQTFSVNNLEEKSRCYIEGTRTALTEELVEPIPDNQVLCQVVADLDNNIEELEQLVMFHRGLVRDIDEEIANLKSLIKMVNDAKLIKPSDNSEVTVEDIQKAKHRFSVMKSELHSLVQALYPEHAEDLMDVLAYLMQQRMDEASDGYVEITSEKFHLTEMLKDMRIVVSNPYNKKEIKLAY